MRTNCRFVDAALEQFIDGSLALASLNLTRRGLNIAIDRHRDVPALAPVSDAIEERYPVITTRHGLTIDDAGPRAQLGGAIESPCL